MRLRVWRPTPEGLNPFKCLKSTEIIAEGKECSCTVCVVVFQTWSSQTSLFYRGRSHWEPLKVYLDHEYHQIAPYHKPCFFQVIILVYPVLLDSPSFRGRKDGKKLERPNGSHPHEGFLDELCQPVTVSFPSRGLTTASNW